MILRDTIDDIFLRVLSTKSVAIEETVAISDGADAIDELVSGGVRVDRADAFAEDVGVMLRW